MISKLIQAFDSDSQTNDVWQFRDVRFDIDPQFEYLEWQKIYGILQNIEDVKGNPGERGTMILTSIRLIWYQLNNTQINLSIGFDLITKMQKKTLVLTSGRSKYYLYLKATKYNSKYEFQFSSTQQDIVSTYDQIIRFYKIASETIQYRKFMLKNVIARNNELEMFKQEKLISKYPNTKYIFQKNQVNGILIFTNVRLAWITNTLDNNINFSLPWISIRSITKREAGNMISIDVEVRDRVAQHHFGLISLNFNQILTEGSRLLQTFRSRPNLGLNYQNEQQIDKQKIKEFKQDIQITETNVNLKKNVRKMQYGNQTTKNKTNSIEFSQELGLAIEQLPDQVTVQDLWKVLK